MALISLEIPKLVRFAVLKKSASDSACGILIPPTDNASSAPLIIAETTGHPVAVDWLIFTSKLHASDLILDSDR
jgi:hypothetical protein